MAKRVCRPRRSLRLGTTRLPSVLLCPTFQCLSLQERALSGQVCSAWAAAARKPESYEVVSFGSRLVAVGGKKRPQWRGRPPSDVDERRIWPLLVKVRSLAWNKWSEIRDLPSLRDLRCFSCRQLGNLPSLVRLELTAAYYYGDLRSLTGLATLALRARWFDCEPSSQAILLLNLPECLTSLDVYFCPGSHWLSPSGSEPFRFPPRLRRLRAGGCVPPWLVDGIRRGGARSLVSLRLAPLIDAESEFGSTLDGLDAVAALPVLCSFAWEGGLIPLCALLNRMQHIEHLDLVHCRNEYLLATGYLRVRLASLRNLRTLLVGLRPHDGHWLRDIVIAALREMGTSCGLLAVRHPQPTGKKTLESDDFLWSVVNRELATPCPQCGDPVGWCVDGNACRLFPRGEW